jgi:hypothetical protein
VQPPFNGHVDEISTLAARYPENPMPKTITTSSNADVLAKFINISRTVLAVPLKSNG